MNLAQAYVELGRMDEARAELKEALRVAPQFSIDFFRRIVPYKDPSVTERTVAALRKAGLD
ncbi:MAG: tetratricopeptide repeat protein [Candidatus Binatia bacterium]